jgi:hypothetical protein
MELTNDLLTQQLIRLNITHRLTKEAITKYNITPVILEQFKDKQELRKYINIKSALTWYDNDKIVNPNKARFVNGISHTNEYRREKYRLKQQLNNTNVLRSNKLPTLIY